MSDRPSADQIAEWATTLSNWGRWGANDSLGTLNLITPDVRRRAIDGVVDAECVPFGWQIDVTRPSTMPHARRLMLLTGEGIADVDRAEPPIQMSADELHIRPHSSDLTHVDALAHVFWRGRMYNDRPASLVTARGGATQLGIETLGHGILTRAVLLDVAASKGVVHLDPGVPVFPDDLEAVEQRQGVTVESGDLAILSTGFSTYRRQHPEWTMATGTPGWQAACLPWLHDREVAMIAHDGPGEVFPSGYDGEVRMPIHSIGIPAMGLFLIDNCDLEQLAMECERRQRWSFLAIVAPLRFTGATGSPVNPIAVF